MKKLIYLLAVLLLGSTVFAQGNKKEVIYLKNGSVLKGQKTRVDDDKIVVRSGKNIWVFNDSEIDTVTTKWLPVAFAEQMEYKPYFFKATAGVLVGSSNNYKEAPFSFDVSFNYNVFSNFYAGLGAGIDFMDESYMPAFANFEYYFRQSRFTPFIGVQAGYMVPLDGEIYSSGTYYYDYNPWSSSFYYSQEALDPKGGIMLNPSLGFVSRLNPNLGFMLSFGYRYHQVNFKGENHYELEREYNRLSIRLGLLFN